MTQPKRTFWFGACARPPFFWAGNIEAQTPNLRRFLPARMSPSTAPSEATGGPFQIFRERTS